jgi:hypothetical protein
VPEEQPWSMPVQLAVPMPDVFVTQRAIPDDPPEPDPAGPLE